MIPGAAVSHVMDVQSEVIRKFESLIVAAIGVIGRDLPVVVRFKNVVGEETTTFVRVRSFSVKPLRDILSVF